MKLRSIDLLKLNKRFLALGKRQFSGNSHDSINEITRKYKLSQDQKSPSLKTSLSLFGIVAAATVGFGSYKVLYKRDPFFLPLWISLMDRQPYKSELDRDNLKVTLIHQLQMRLSLTDTATDLIGVACKIDAEDARNQLSIKVRCSTPGVSGIYVSPTPSWSWGLSWYPFTKRTKTGPENLMSGPSGMGNISDDAANMLKRSNSEIPVQEAIITGKFCLRSSSVAVCHQIDSAFLEFHATKNMDLPGEPPKINFAYLVYDNPNPDGPASLRTRLW